MKWDRTRTSTAGSPPRWDRESLFLIQDMEYSTMWDMNMDLDYSTMWGHEYGVADWNGWL